MNCSAFLLKLSNCGLLNSVSIDTVGAIINRPAVQSYEFADIQCEYATSVCRAVNDRPYIRNRNHSAN